MIFISGPFYYIREHLQEYKFSKIDEDTSDRLERAITALSSFGLFGNEFVLLANIDKWTKKEREKLIPYLNDTTIVTASVPDMREKFFKTLKSKANKQFVFEYIKPWETDKWIKYIIDSSKKYGLNVDKGIAFEILKIVGEDYDRLHSELRKLSFIKKGSITSNDLQYISDSVIDFTNSIVEDILTRKKPYEKIDSFYKFKMQPISLVYALMRNYKMLLIIKNTVKKKNLSWNSIKEYSKRLKISSGVLAKFVGFSFSRKTKSIDYRSLYTTKQLYKILEKLLELEAGIKIFDTKAHFTTFINYLEYEL